jgi:cytoskeletal protein RodZ
MPANWQTLGGTLRKARERKGVTLVEAQQTTKVRQAFLAALENDDYSILPPAVYVRGFIKNYATYLGLDSQICVQAFDEMMEAAAAGYEPYYGSSDSGGKGLHPAEHSQILSGLSQGEARLLESSPEILNMQPQLAASEEENSEKTTDASTEKQNDEEFNPTINVPIINSSTINNSRALVRVTPPPAMGLRPYEKYVLRPAIQPISKPAFYIPNFIPLLLVLLIVAAAFILAYRGLVMPKVDNTLNATATPNLTSIPAITVPTSGVTGENGITITNTATTTIVTVLTPPPFFTPINTPNSTAKPAGIVAPGSAVNLNTPTDLAPTATPTNLPTSTPSGPTATPTPDPNATVTIEINVTRDSSWLGVVVDGRNQLTEVRYPTEGPISFTGKRIEVRAGAPDAITIKVNGVDKPYNDPHSGIITHVYNGDGTDFIQK